MNINLHIERLVLDGLPVASVHDATIQAAVETELARQLAEEGLPQTFGGSARNISGGQIQWPAENNPAQIGQRIAHTVHSALASPRTNQGGRR